MFCHFNHHDKSPRLSIIDNSRHSIIMNMEIYGDKHMILNVSLTPKLEELIKTKVSSGMYNSASEVVREALRLLDERDRIAEIRLETLREEIRKGAESGPGIPADEVFNCVREKINATAEEKHKESTGK